MPLLFFPSSPQIRFRQKGLVLIVGLIFLMLLTVIGITSMSTTTLTEKMTQNMRDTSNAFEAAEAGLGDAEAWVQKQTSVPIPVSTCSASPCKVWTYNALGNFYQQPDSWWQSTGIPFSSSLSGVSLQPYYVIELYSLVPYDLSPDSASKGYGYYYYRITAHGTGSTNTAHAVVQSIFATQYN